MASSSGNVRDAPTGPPPANVDVQAVASGDGSVAGQTVIGARVTNNNNQRYYTRPPQTSAADNAEHRDFQTTDGFLRELDHLFREEWCVRGNTSFNKSLLHREIVSRGIQTGKIKMINWDIGYEANIPKEEIQIATLILEVNESAKRFANTTGEEIRCRHLECHVYSGAERTCKEFALFLKTINFEHISFIFADTENCHDWLSLFHQDKIINQLLRSRPIKVMRCGFTSQIVHYCTVLKALNYLVGENSVCELEVIIFCNSNNSESNTSADFEIGSPLLPLQISTPTSVLEPPECSKDNLDLLWQSFFENAGKSERLTKLEIINYDETYSIEINTDLMADHGRKLSAYHNVKFTKPLD